MTQNTENNNTENDLVVSGGGSVFILTPTSDTGREWCDEHLHNPNDPDGEPMMFGGGIVVEHRYIEEIVAGAQADGLVVA